jgi:excisionase family DNA binding protein
MKKQLCRSTTGTASPALIQLEERLMKVDEVAFMLGVSPRSIWRLIASGEFPNRVKIRRCVRLPGCDIQAYLEKNKSH